MLYRATLLLMVITMNITTAFANTNEWNLVKDKNGIQAYTRSVPNSDHLQFKSEGVVKTNIASLVYLMRDMEVMDRWLHTCYEPVLVEESDKATRLIHMKNETPFVVKDRDLVLTQKMIKVSDTKVLIELAGKPESLEKNSKYVRIPMFHGAWRLTQIDQDSTNVEYFGHIDPGGAIPAFITNSMLVDTPYESIRKLRKQDYSQYDGSLEFLTSLEFAELEETKALATN